jgi:hypothetical protein
MGIATENIGVGVNGIVMSFGTLTGLDTRGTAESALAVGDEDWDEGTILYAHPTVPGKLTEVRPQHDLAIAFTTVRHGSTGQIAIRIVPGNFHLEWMHDVSADSPSDGDILQYKTSSTLWTKSSIAGAGIAVSTHTHDYAAAVHTHPQSAITNLVTDLGTINTAVTSAQTTADTASTTATDAVPKNTVTTKGDIIVGSAASAVARLGVGTDGQILTARSTATNGVAWEAAAGGSSSISFNTYTVSSNFASTDKDKIVQGNSTAAISLTVTSTIGLADGDQIHILQTGTGQVTIVAGAGVTINSALGLKLRAQWSSATLIERSSNVWVLIGDCEA